MLFRGCFHASFIAFLMKEIAIVLIQVSEAGFGSWFLSGLYVAMILLYFSNWCSGDEGDE